jgi:hypothetical protein
MLWTYQHFGGMPAAFAHMEFSLHFFCSPYGCHITTYQSKSKGGSLVNY